MNRRAFLEITGLAVGAAAVGPVVAAGDSRNDLALPTLGERTAILPGYIVEHSCEKWKPTCFGWAYHHRVLYALCYGPARAVNEVGPPLGGEWMSFARLGHRVQAPIPGFSGQSYPGVVLAALNGFKIGRDIPEVWVMVEGLPPGTPAETFYPWAQKSPASRP